MTFIEINLASSDFPGDTAINIIGQSINQSFFVDELPRRLVKAKNIKHGTIQHATIRLE